MPTFVSAGMTFMGYPLALDDRRYNPQGLTPSQLQMWKSHFGVCEQASYIMWLLLLREFEQEMPKGLDLQAFFMSLFFLKTYPTN